MEGIEKITAKILSDAQADIDQLNAQTQEKADAIARQAQAQADKETADILARGQKAAAERLGITQEILMEINIGAEESKSGVGPDDLWPLLDAAAAKTHIKVRGLMAIPPADADDTATRRFFAEMRELLAKAAARGYENARMNILSMGMSHDYAAAIAEGATIVRVGTAIYGARDYSKKH